jgi:hypothetical protein
MLNPYPSPPIEPETSLPSTSAQSVSSLAPRLWDQIDLAGRRQLAQMVAELIRRLRLPTPDQEADHDHPA